MKKQTYYMVNKLALTPNEKKNLIKEGKLIIDRELRRVPASSIIYGTGKKTIFDKVAYKWIVGDTDKYIIDNMNVGRRAVDYPDNKKNNWSGAYWWDCERNLNEFTIDKPIVNGTKHKLTFNVIDYYVDTLKTDENYLRPILKYILVLV